MTMIRIPLIASLLCLLPLAASALTYLVLDDGSGDFPTIQAAIDACVDGDIVELGDGTFTGPGNRDMDFAGRAITVRSQSGNAGSCTIDCQGDYANWRRAFHFHSGEGMDSRLRDLRITGGYQDGYEFGGGIWIENQSSPEISGCIFDGCYGFMGGALGILADSSPVISDCEFRDSSGHLGGAIFCVDWFSAPVISDCLFVGGDGEDGGGMYCDTCRPTLIRCTFDDNWGEEGGAVFFIDVFDFPTLTDCVFLDNFAMGVGGALCVREGSPVISGCLFAGNETDGRGGALYSQDWQLASVIRDCTFVGNISTTEGSGICVYDSADLNLENCIIALGVHGEAVYCVLPGASVTLTCCDVFGNEGGDWVACIAGQGGVAGNISADPLFCDADLGDYSLHALSPCLPENNDCGVLMGAFPLGCGLTATEATSWGAIKSLY